MKKVTKGTFRRDVFFIILIIHLLAAYAAVYGWKKDFPRGAWICFGILYITSSVGISMGYHRLFTHNAFKCSDLTKKILVVLGALAIEGPMKEWVRDHRTHHAFGDQEGDPHTPNNGFWWAHCGWVFYTIVRPTGYKPLQNFDSHIALWQGCWYWYFALSGFLIPLLAGFGAGLYYSLSFGQALRHGLEFFLLAGPVRMVIHLHATWSVNSFGHTFGIMPKDQFGRPFSNTRARNCWLILLPTFVGEWLHGYHHAEPNCAYFAWRWWQPDLVKWIIIPLRKLGIVWDVVTPRPRTT